MLKRLFFLLMVISSNPINQIQRLKNLNNTEVTGFPLSAISKIDLETIEKLQLPFFGENGNFVESG